MEGGTDFDLQVLEAPTAPAGGETTSSSSGGGGGGGERSQGDSSEANVSANTGPESTGGRTDDTTRGETGETKNSDKVRTNILIF